jgi:hypothetical protein
MLKVFRVGLLDFVEDNDGVRPAADRFGQLAGILVAHIAGRRADQPSDIMALHEF